MRSHTLQHKPLPLRSPPFQNQRRFIPPLPPPHLPIIHHVRSTDGAGAYSALPGK